MKNKIKNALKKAGALTIAFTAGLVVFIGALSVYAAWNTTKAPGEQIDATDWNNMAVQVQGWTRMSAAADSNVFLGTTGNVGIGTSAPTHKLDIATATGTNAEINIKTGAKSPWGIYHHEATEELRFWNGNDAIKMTKAGQLNINSATSQAAINLSGVSDSGLTYSALYLDDDITSTPAPQNAWVFAHSKQEADKLSINYFTPLGAVIQGIIMQTNGNVGIGKTDPSEKLDVNGTIKATGMFIGTNEVATKAYVDAAAGGGGVKMISAASLSNYTHANAAKYCWDLSATAEASMDGDTTTSYSDWRLPSVEEIAIFEGTINNSTFLWTSSPGSSDAFYYVIKLNSGESDSIHYTNTNRVRCIR